MKSQAVLFGLNYQHTRNAKLNGCINDVKNMSQYLSSLGVSCKTYTDDTDLYSTSAQGIVARLYEAAIDTYRNNLDFLWIHYSGHGAYIRDTTGDEVDGRDECLIPSDFEMCGVVPDDILQNIFNQMNPRTRVVCIFDACHSGTLGDIKYSWERDLKFTIENPKCGVKSKIITLSGCLDDQTSADAFNVLKDGKFGGALTGCLLLGLKGNKLNNQHVFAMLADMKKRLKDMGFGQIPKLCSSHDLMRDSVFIPRFK